MNKLIIFTDLDGTLLNHDDYSFEDALPALKKLKQLKIPVIFTTSKTRAEIEVLQKQLGVTDPFISENGGGIFFQEKYNNFSITHCKHYKNYCLIQLGKNYNEIVQFEKKVMDKYKIKGFFFMSVEEVSRLTGLPVEIAKLSKERDFTEPFIIEDETKIPLLSKEAKKYGIKITKGGRFYHLIGENQDKGKAVKIVLDIFKKNTGEKVVSIGLGDSKNDIPMLNVVDIPVLIKKPDGSFEKLDRIDVIRSKFPGSKGWNQVVLELLDELL